MSALLDGNGLMGYSRAWSFILVDSKGQVRDVAHRKRQYFYFQVLFAKIDKLCLSKPGTFAVVSHDVHVHLHNV